MPTARWAWTRSTPIPRAPEPQRRTPSPQAPSPCPSTKPKPEPELQARAPSPIHGQVSLEELLLLKFAIDNDITELPARPSLDDDPNVMLPNVVLKIDWESNHDGSVRRGAASNRNRPSPTLIPNSNSLLPPRLGGHVGLLPASPTSLPNYHPS